MSAQLPPRDPQDSSPDSTGTDETMAASNPTVMDLPADPTLDPPADPPADPPIEGELTEGDDALDAHRMTLLEHLSDLRVRLRNSAIVFVVALIGGFFFVRTFFKWLTRPVMQGLRDAGYPETLSYIGPMETFWVFMKLAIVLGIMVASPLIFWELWKFIAPGLYKKEKKLALLITISTAVCFVGGAAFAYFVLARPAMYYMMELGKVPDLDIQPMLTIELVANFLMMFLAGSGVAFELPVVLSILGWLGIVSARSLWKFNKYALVLSMVAGGVLTPSADPMSQLMLAGPLYVLYNLSIIVVHFIEKARKKKEAELEKEYGDDGEKA